MNLARGIRCAAASVGLIVAASGINITSQGPSQEAGAAGLGWHLDKSSGLAFGQVLSSCSG
jgi:hypothetical protein